VDLKDPINRRERLLLEVVAQLPKFCDKDVLQRIFRIYFSAPRHSAISKSVLNHFGSSDFVDAVGRELGSDLAATWREILLSQLPVLDVSKFEEYAQGVVDGALAQTVEFEKQFLLKALVSAQAGNREAESKQIQAKLTELTAELVALRAKR
jgi:hypothetical protein